MSGCVASSAHRAGGNQQPRKWRSCPGARRKPGHRTVSCTGASTAACSGAYPARSTKRRQDGLPRTVAMLESGSCPIAVIAPATGGRRLKVDSRPVREQVRNWLGAGRKRLMAKITGGCLCGRVRYSIDGEPPVTGVCHCKDCQRETGSAFAVAIVVPNQLCRSRVKRRLLAIRRIAGDRCGGVFARNTDRRSSVNLPGPALA
jgi:hypothetical protein